MSPNSTTKVSKRDEIIGIIIILLCSFLLGVWAVKGTIALRNILIGIATPISILYIANFIVANWRNVPIKAFLPILFLLSTLSWVVIHYIYFSSYPELQWAELRSTWFRSFLALLIGFACGISIARNSRFEIYLWTGLICSFIFLFFQYLQIGVAINRFIFQGSALFIYPGKISGVLAGTTLILGLTGMILSSTIRNKINSALICLWLCTVALLLYTYVYIFDSRSGVALTVIIITIAILYFLERLIAAIRLQKKIDLVNTKIFVIVTLLFLLLIFFGIQHKKNNPGWNSYIEDSAVAINVEQYSNWRNTELLGYPKTKTGATVARNTYERIAWATAGLKILLPENLIGVGIMNGAFGILLNQKYSDVSTTILSSHSGLVEFLLAFGVPGIILITGAFVSPVILALNSQEAIKGQIILMPVGLAILYFVGELNTQHAIEILFFLLALLSAQCLFLKQIIKR